MDPREFVSEAMTAASVACGTYTAAIKGGEAQVVVEPGQSAGCYFLTAYVEGEPVGSLSVGPNRHDESKWSAMSVGVDPERRRMGVATALYDAAVAAGISPLVPDDKRSEDAHGLWESQREPVQLGKPAPPYPSEWGQTKNVVEGGLPAQRCDKCGQMTLVRRGFEYNCTACGHNNVDETVKIPTRDEHDCPDCETLVDGVWRTGRCDVCRGFGSVDNAECSNCEGTGSPRCCRCEGTGKDIDRKASAFVREAVEEIPEVLYHGTSSEPFVVFDRTDDIGFHFTVDPEAADARLNSERLVGPGVPEYPDSARIMPVRLLIRNPLRLPDLHTWDPDSVLRALRDAGVIYDSELEPEMGFSDSEIIVDKDFVERALAEKGYDSIVYRNETEYKGDEENQSDSYIVFRPQQVKSVFNQKPNPRRRSVVAGADDHLHRADPDKARRLQDIARPCESCGHALSEHLPTDWLMPGFLYSVVQERLEEKARKTGCKLYYQEPAGNRSCSCPGFIGSKAPISPDDVKGGDPDARRDELLDEMNAHPEGSPERQRAQERLRSFGNSRKEAFMGGWLRKRAMDDMVMGYLEAALFAETDNADDSGGDPLDENYHIDSFSPESIARAEADCEAFSRRAAEWVRQMPAGVRLDQLGHDFWLTRNGHGAGFWDRPEMYGKQVADALSGIASEFGSVDIAVGADGVLHFEGGSIAPEKSGGAAPSGEMESEAAPEEDPDEGPEGGNVMDGTVEHELDRLDTPVSRLVRKWEKQEKETKAAPEEGGLLMDELKELISGFAQANETSLKSAERGLINDMLADIDVYMGREPDLGHRQDLGRFEEKDSEAAPQEMESESAKSGMSQCRHCGAFINLAFGAEPPSAHEGAAGTEDDPRSPGDHDDICDVCNYAEGLRGGPGFSPRNAGFTCPFCGNPGTKSDMEMDDLEGTGKMVPACTRCAKDTKRQTGQTDDELRGAFD